MIKKQWSKMNDKEASTSEAGAGKIHTVQVHCDLRRIGKLILLIKKQAHQKIWTIDGSLLWLIGIFLRPTMVNRKITQNTVVNRLYGGGG